ncbi:MAG: EamA family transporter [Anaerolineae bacterium]
MRTTSSVRPQRAHVQNRGFWWVTGAAILWGTIGVATQAIFTVDQSSSLFINFGRLAIAAPIMAAACWRQMGRRMLVIPRRDFWLMMLNGSFLAISQAAYFAAIREIGVTLSTLLTICVSPLVVTALSVLMRRESLTGRVVVALLLALSGGALLVGFPTTSGSGEAWGAGIGFALFAAFTYAIALQAGRFLARDYHPLQVTTMTFSAGAVVLLVVNVVGGTVILQTAQGWALLIYLALVPTALAYGLFQTGLRSVSATSASIISMLDPLVAALLAWVLFGETLSVTGMMGGLLMLGSMGLLMADPSGGASTSTEAVTVQDSQNTL